MFQDVLRYYKNVQECSRYFPVFPVFPNLPLSWVFHPMRSGDVVLVLLPQHGGSRRLVVALVMSVWVGVGKPKLTTCKTAIGHCVALRIVIMQESSGNVFQCNGTSEAWMVKPEAIVAVLAFKMDADEDKEVGLCSVELTEESVALAKTLESLESISLDAFGLFWILVVSFDVLRWSMFSDFIVDKVGKFMELLCARLEDA